MLAFEERLAVSNMLNQIRNFIGNSILIVTGRISKATKNAILLNTITALSNTTSSSSLHCKTRVFLKDADIHVCALLL
jgi:hypothetical protein